MALNVGLGLRSISPTSSNESPHRGRRGTREQHGILTKDKSFRRYAAGVERALGLFDTALQEWADYISFLSRLLKALQNHPDGIAQVPDKFIVAKRLAQCLHPSLPSGVHQKALEVYAFIFAFIGEDGLADDLGVYLPGIVPTLTFASVSVRPLFLSLIEKYILRVSTTSLRPALKALILALLPGLDEETSDDFENTLQTLNKCKHAYTSAGGGEVFWQNLFLASITSPGKRQGVLAYMSRCLPKLGKGDLNAIEVEDEGKFDNAEAAFLTTPEPGLLLRCFATGLSDDQVLVQRAFLDLLVTHLPLHSSIFRDQVLAEDHEMLLSAAVGVVLRRDMSLNRRLWSWFLGPAHLQRVEEEKIQPSSHSQIQMKAQIDPQTSQNNLYFEKYCALPLISTLQAEIEARPLASSKASRPFRIALSLMDRWEIGGPVVDANFLPLLRSLREYRENAPSEGDFEEVFRSANVFFDGVESTLIWSKIFTLVNSDGKLRRDILRDMDLASFVIAHFSVREEEMLLLHVPLASLALLESLFSAEKDRSMQMSPLLDSEIQVNAFDLLRVLLEMIPERAFSKSGATESSAGLRWSTVDQVDQVQKSVKSFKSHYHGAVESSKSPFLPETLAKFFLDLLTPMILVQITEDASGANLSRRAQLLILLLDKLPYTVTLDRTALFFTMKERLAAPSMFLPSLQFPVLACLTTLLIKMSAQDLGRSILQSGEAELLVPLLAQHLWPYLSLSSPQHHVETVRLLHNLQHLTWQDEIVTSTLSALIMGTEKEAAGTFIPSKASLERFFSLWTHHHSEMDLVGTKSVAKLERINSPNADSRAESMAALSAMLACSMVSVLGILHEPYTEGSVWCRNWLHSLFDLSSIFESIITPIRKSLNLENLGNTSDSECIERGNHLIGVLHQLVTVQSREQWLTFSRSPRHNLASRPTSRMTESDLDSLQMVVMRLSCEILRRDPPLGGKSRDEQELRLQRGTLRLIRQLISSSDPVPLLTFHIDQHLVHQLADLDAPQLTSLESDRLDTLLQILSAKVAIARLREPGQEHSLDEGQGHSHRETSNPSKPSARTQSSEQTVSISELVKVPDGLLASSLRGISNHQSQAMIQKWIQVLCDSTHLNLFPLSRVLMSIVECFCKQIQVCFEGMKAQYEGTSPVARNFETPLLHLLNGLDFILARAHEQLLTEEEGLLNVKTPELQQGFFGSMVSGAASPEHKQGRNAANNNRLTVILCFQDAIRFCFKVWSWQALSPAGGVHSLASFQNTSQKIRSRSRKILEHLLVAEPLEGIEVLADLWITGTAEKTETVPASLLGLTHTLEASRARVTMLSLFNAIYSRTNPTALVLSQKSTLSSNLQECDLVVFMSEYVQSLEDDILDEIWEDCTTFLRDVLGNPMPHRQILTNLIKFIAILSTKMENTNYGEERKMRKELGDLFVRLLTAIFTIKPQSSAREKTAAPSSSLGVDSVEQILDQNFTVFSSLLGESDRLVTVMASVVTQLITPLFRSRLFPQNVTPSTLSLLYKISKVPSSAKAWKKDLTDSFNDPRIFSFSLALVKNGLQPLIRQLVLMDKGLLPELLSRFTAPTMPGIMFGVGATAARLEADKRTQLNLRRVALLLTVDDNDTSAAHLKILQAKVEELLSASAVSSPSSTTRADFFLTFRALALKNSPGLMVSFWPMLTSELRIAFTSLVGNETQEDPSRRLYNDRSLLQAAKLLDVLLLTDPEDFQPQEWLFVTDTVDAIYRPNDWEPTALADEVAQTMMTQTMEENSAREDPKSTNTPHSAGRNPLTTFDDDHGPHTNELSRVQKPWLCGEHTRRLTSETEIREKLLRPFFAQLSIHVYEWRYSLSEPDLGACRNDLLADLFDEGSFVAG